MSERFVDYKEASRYARKLARTHNYDVAVRRTREYGRDGYNVSFACRNDSDYALAEIVTAADPFTE